MWTGRLTGEGSRLTVSHERETRLAFSTYRRFDVRNIPSFVSAVEGNHPRVEGLKLLSCLAVCCLRAGEIVGEGDSIASNLASSQESFRVHQDLTCKLHRRTSLALSARRK